jgi:uncharacterized protein YkwD
MKTFITALILGLIIVLSAVWAAQAQAYTAEDILTAINKSRSTPLVMNPELTRAAQDKANLLISCGCFAHTVNGKRFYSVIQDHRISYLNAGENLALGFGNILDLNTAWLNSPSHRANILGSYTETGIAVAKGMYQGRETIFVVQLFITPLTK